MNKFNDNDELNYGEIIRKLLMSIHYSQIPDYIEKYYNQSLLKGITFYSKLINEIPLHGSANNFPSKKNDIVNHCMKKIKELNGTNNIDGIKGFQCSLTNEQIEKLFNQMQGFIDATPANFRAIFKDEPLPPGFIPIKRKKIFTSSLCAYFISELFQKDNPRDYWSIAENCFDVKNLRKSFNNAIQYNTNGKPKGFEKIDTILQNIYTPLL
ncbi:MAG: hypothetical protein NTY07_02235 [Bacteroidia bacterium]|nr:hypothetical protein [Bacteroidia bacterium]